MATVLLRDAELEAMLNARPSLVAGLDRSRQYTDAKSPVQGSSIDLTMGKIFLPEVGPADLGGINNPRREHSLSPGHTAVVETAQRLQMPSNLAAIGFPPAHVSARGLLATNPGHVDPGYEGHLSLTVINMGREAFPLKQDEPMVTLLFYKLDAAPDADYGTRYGAPAASAVSADRLGRLSADFLQIEERATQIAKNEEARARRTALWISGATVLATLLVGVLGVFLPTRNQVNDLRTEVKVLQKQLDLKNVEHRLQKLEHKAK